MLSVRNVVLGISGGVDSSVAAILLKKKGFNVIGVFMRNWDLADENGICTVQEEYEDAKYVCSRLKIPFEEVNFVKEYWNEVFTTFLSDYEGGLTPNPDVLCNKFIKFKAFYNHAINNLKADAIATGHYAKTSFGDYLERYQPGVNARLYVPKDQFKDQTLFLSQVPQEALRRTMFPLGGLNKDEVRRIAVENGLEKIAAKAESAGICFIGRRKFSNFISDYVTPKPGNIIDILEGKVLGTHKGQHLFTVGQRTRLILGGVTCIVKKVPNTTDMYAVRGNHHPLLYSRMMFTGKPYWIADEPDFSSEVKEFKFRFQHGRTLRQCQVVELKSGGLFLTLERPLRALTPGQYAVLYEDTECLGSARISEVGPSEFALGNAVPKECIEQEDREPLAPNGNGNIHCGNESSAQ